MEIRGIDREKVKAISEIKKEDNWIQKYRLDSFSMFEKLDMPSFGPEIDLDFSEIIYYKANERDEMIQSDWNNVLKPVVDELDELGVLESEKHLGGMGVQYESEVIGKSEISLEDLENYILISNEFYKDRIRIAEKRLFKGKKKRKMMRMIAHDEELLRKWKGSLLKGNMVFKR